jgi:PIN domain nuclease of toxin-antitoxin system
VRLLLDTHTLLWWMSDDPQLTPGVRRLIEDGTNSLYFSVASGWEVAIKVRLGKLTFPEPEINLPRHLADNAITPLPIAMEHALHTSTLPFHHRDPFDQLLIAQSQLEEMPILTSDALIAAYSVETLWPK